MNGRLSSPYLVTLLSLLFFGYSGQPIAVTGVDCHVIKCDINKLFGRNKKSEKQQV
jgi:hypothetical protein